MKRVRIGRGHQLFMLVAATVVGSCEADRIYVSRTGTLQSTITTTGAELDPDGYQLVFRFSNTSIPMPTNGRITTSLAATTYVVELGGLAENCQLNGNRVRTVSIAAGKTTQVAFDVTCVATAVLDVTTATTGVDLDPNGYRVTSVLNQAVDRGAAPTNGHARIRGLPAGEYTVQLREVAANCDVAGGHERRLTMASGDTAAVEFHIACTSATQLVYARGEHIHVINSNGTGATQLTHTGANGEPAWSPDGSRIAFTGGGDIRVMDADGSNARQLTTHPAADYQPAWSPDGKKIAFVSERDGGVDLYIMNADGTNQTLLTTDFVSENREPAWSPDGRKIAFSRRRDRISLIYVMNADGTGIVPVTSGFGADESPAWSPDGSRLAFSRPICVHYPCLPTIHVMNADGSNVRVVATGIHPAWSADGRRIAYAAIICLESYYCSERREFIRIVHADGDDGGPTVVDLTGGDHDARPAWRR